MARFRGGKGRANNRDYVVRAFRAPKELAGVLDELTLASGRLYSACVTEYWRVVRRHGVFLKETDLRKLVVRNEHSDTGLLHSQSRQQVVSAFSDAMATWRANRRENPSARPPYKQKRYFKVSFIQMGIRMTLIKGQATLVLSLGKDASLPRPPLQISMPRYLANFAMPSKVEIGWRKDRAGGGYEVRCTWTKSLPQPLAKTGTELRVAAVDLGEVHPYVISDGERSVITNGGHLRALSRYRNKVQGRLDQRIARTKSGSRRRQRLVASKRRQLGTLSRQRRDVEHKLSAAAVADMVQTGITELVIGDLRRVRQDNPSKAKASEAKPSKGRRFNQRLHQAPLGRSRHYLTYKARRKGITVVELQDEAYTTKTCPSCGKRNSTSNRCYRCERCGLKAHRDAVGAFNIRAKYLGIAPWGPVPAEVTRVVGAVAAPSGRRYHPHLRAGPASAVADPHAASG